MTLVLDPRPSYCCWRGYGAATRATGTTTHAGGTGALSLAEPQLDARSIGALLRTFGSDGVPGGSRVPARSVLYMIRSFIARSGLVDRPAICIKNVRTPLANSPDWLKAAPMRENLLASWRQSGQKQDPCPSLLNHNAKYKRLLPPYCDFANGVGSKMGQSSPNPDRSRGSSACDIG